MVSFLLVLVLSLLVGVATDVTNSDSSQLCSNYLSCLQKLEATQRECSPTNEKRTSSNEVLPSLETGKSTSGDGGKSAKKSCKKKRKIEIQHDLSQLYLRRTETIRDCVANNGTSQRNSFIHGAKISAKKEKKCLTASAKLTKLLDGKSRNSKKGKEKNAGDALLPISSGVNKRISPDKKHCRRDSKAIARKCQQMAKCCPIASRCELGSETISGQIAGLKKELKAPLCKPRQ